MLILGVDTSGREGSLALLSGDANASVVLERVPLAGRQYSAELIPQLAAMLQRHSLHKREVEAYAVAVGPGSFTGLRVGIATVKGLAEIFGRPVAAVSVLEAVAATSVQPGRVIAAVDAGRREIFVGQYSIAGETIQCTREILLTHSEFEALLNANPSAQLITPDLDIGELARFHMQVKQVERPHADVIARIGLRKIATGLTVPPELLEANYIRRSDAEISLERRS